MPCGVISYDPHLEMIFQQVFWPFESRLHFKSSGPQRPKRRSQSDEKPGKLSSSLRNYRLARSDLYLITVCFGAALIQCLLAARTRGGQPEGRRSQGVGQQPGPRMGAFDCMENERAAWSKYGEQFTDRQTPSPLDKGWGLSRPSAATAAAAAVFFDPVACSNACLRISAFSVFLPSSVQPAHLALQGSVIDTGTTLRRCRRPSAPLDHQLALREELVRGNAISASHQAYRHGRLECLLRSVRGQSKARLDFFCARRCRGHQTSCAF